MAEQTIFSDLSADPTQFKSDLQTALSNSNAWKGSLTTQVGTALIDAIASLGAFCHHQINNAYANCFQETATLDDSIRAIAIMQGIRLTRRLPAAMKVELTSDTDVTISTFTQFICSGYAFFNREVIELEANKPLQVTLYQGTVNTKFLRGSGTDLQSWVSDESLFSVSDEDVYVLINNVLITKAYGSLWNYKNAPAYMDSTTMEGRLLIQFGTSQFGSVPGVNDTIAIIYCVTQGEAGNNYNTAGSQVTVQGYNAIRGTAVENPSGGANQKSALAYKNNTAGSFGTYGSAVTKSQYSAIVNTYPGVIDAFTQSQRERNPSDLKLMNVITVTGITSSPWSEEQKQDFCEWCQQQSMYTTRFVWIDATPVPRDISLQVFCYNSSVLSVVQQNVESAIRALFRARPGILMTDFYRSDIITTVRNADSGIAYVVIDKPVEDMPVTQPSSPRLTFEITDSGGTLAPYFYSYGITYVDNTGVESEQNAWAHPQVTVNNSKVRLYWQSVPSAVTYKLFGRMSESIGLIKEIKAEQAQLDEETGYLYFDDDGSITPDTSKYVKYRMPEIRYNTLGKLDVRVEFADRQQRISTPSKTTK